MIELGPKATAQQEINISFRHTNRIFERVEEFELDEFLSSQINWFKYKIPKAVYKQNSYVQALCWISLTLSFVQNRDTDSNCESGN
jgi:hypothetical protein